MLTEAAGQGRRAARWADRSSRLRICSSCGRDAKRGPACGDQGREQPHIDSGRRAPPHRTPTRSRSSRGQLVAHRHRRRSRRSGLWRRRSEWFCHFRRGCPIHCPAHSRRQNGVARRCHQRPPSGHSARHHSPPRRCVRPNCRPAAARPATGTTRTSWTSDITNSTPGGRTSSSTRR